MNIAIIEDEKLAAEHITRLIKQADSSIHIATVLDSIKTSVEWFSQNPMVDLVLMDIQLSDGLSFEIFDRIKLNVPVIFTTAYDEYALRAFKVNSVDYLLKPISPNDLEKALNKFKLLHEDNKNEGISQQLVRQLLTSVSSEYRKRFLVKTADKLQFIDCKSINYFVSIESNTFLHTANRLYDIDFTLDELTSILNPADFYRINRKYIISMSAIHEMHNWPGNRILIKLNAATDEELLVSREKVSEFKQWIDN
jgi:DNA-binding LytR/AlgR family response regulator